jgi:hypothetical protein
MRNARMDICAAPNSKYRIQGLSYSQFKSSARDVLVTTDNRTTIDCIRTVGTVLHTNIHSICAPKKLPVAKEASKLPCVGKK